VGIARTLNYNQICLQDEEHFWYRFNIVHYSLEKKTEIYHKLLKWMVAHTLANIFMCTHSWILSHEWCFCQRL